MDNKLIESFNKVERERAAAVRERDRLASENELLAAQSRTMQASLIEARHMVLRLRCAVARQGHEPGDTEDEMMMRSLDALANWGMDPTNDRARVLKILRRYNPEATL